MIRPTSLQVLWRHRQARRIKWVAKLSLNKTRIICSLYCQNKAMLETQSSPIFSTSITICLASQRQQAQDSLGLWSTEACSLQSQAWKAQLLWKKTAAVIIFLTWARDLHQWSKVNRCNSLLQIWSLISRLSWKLWLLCQNWATLSHCLSQPVNSVAQILSLLTRTVSNKTRWWLSFRAASVSSVSSKIWLRLLIASTSTNRLVAIWKSMRRVGSPL